MGSVAATFASFAYPLQGCANPIGIVEALKTGDPFGAEGPAVDGMEGVPSDIDSPSVNDPYQDTAPTHTLAADGGDPSFDTRFKSFFDRRKLAPLCRNHRLRRQQPRASAYLQRLPSIHLHVKTSIRH